ncbi:hypothetical protein [Marinospirillum insulare]|uniref:Twin-arginine translocation signal domain-containing protein n=1 Tax=Marinospirillum insulare TaxID=217169 RepID=A0ABQ5ZUL1_9GAMM|nr:hypothetical protein [Marinospirillum insulare]GLR63107.1 hypothetical protein GCM10007878_05420 [Marinospirillum insulare]
MPKMTYQLTRRGFLKLGLASGAALSFMTVTLGVTSLVNNQTASGFSYLRSQDIAMLNALLPVIYTATVTNNSAEQTTQISASLIAIDYNLAHLSPSMRKLTLQLFDLITNPVTRGPLTGIWGAWSTASPETIQHFLNRWEASRWTLLNQGQAAILQLARLAYYSQPQSWQLCGYPGPPNLG